MDTDYWENHLKDFLIETAEMYYSFLDSKHPKYAVITTLEGSYGVFQEVSIQNIMMHFGYYCIFCRDGILL